MRLAQALHDLAAALAAGDALWREQAFCEPVLTWEADHPDLSSTLRGLDANALDVMANDSERAGRWLREAFPALPWPTLPSFEPLPRFALDPPSAFSLRDIPGRKLQQIHAFTACLPRADDAVLEWCSGKSHLGRYLLQCGRGSHISALEFDNDLCEAAMGLARRQQLPVDSHCVDVMSGEAGNWLQGVDHAVALHACGDLHLRLLELVVDAAIPEVSLAPCCYHLSRRIPWNGLTAELQSYEFRFSDTDLRTAVQETVTAPSHARRQRRRLQCWQLGWDLLRRELTGDDGWQPIPRQAGADDFESFCRGVAQNMGIEIPADQRFGRFERAGIERMHQVTALDLVRHQFRRPLEQLLVLDRALWLEQQGYRVTVGTFCERTETPRNILIRAALGVT